MCEEFWFGSQQGQEVFLFSATSRLGLESTQSSLQWVLGALLPGIKRGRAWMRKIIHLLYPNYYFYDTRLIKLYETNQEPSSRESVIFEIRVMLAASCMHA
jgi:hypothetical protein